MPLSKVFFETPKLVLTKTYYSSTITTIKVICEIGIQSIA